MASNAAAILAGIAGGSGGTGLAWFAPLGTTAPTDATTVLNVAFKDAGICTEAGLTVNVTENTKDVNGFGLSAPARTLVTSSKTEFGLGFLESNPVSLAVYHRKALADLTPDTTGAFDFTTGAHESQRYAFVFDVTDGTNHLRGYAPNVEVTGRDNFAVAAGQEISYGVTMTAYPGTDGTAIHWYYVVDAVKSA